MSQFSYFCRRNSKITCVHFLLYYQISHWASYLTCLCSHAMFYIQYLKLINGWVMFLNKWKVTVIEILSKYQIVFDRHYHLLIMKIYCIFIIDLFLQWFETKWSRETHQKSKIRLEELNDVSSRSMHIHLVMAGAQELNEISYTSSHVCGNGAVRWRS